MDMDGVSVREVLGDWSNTHECDRLPKYLADGPVSFGRVSPYDKSDTRLPIEQRVPGKSISALEGVHDGSAVILFNGHSLAEHDLWRIAYPIIGMNRTHVGFRGYQGPQPDYLCIVDWAWLHDPSLWTTVRTHPRIINGASHSSLSCPLCKKRNYTDRDIGYRATRHSRMAPFSFDLARDGFVGPVPATTGFFALQVAVYMGFTEIFCLGLDLGGTHFDGTPPSLWVGDANRYFKRQAVLLADRGIKVWVCGSPKSACTAFPHTDFEACT
jgi:hypothetical protein